MKRPGGSGSRPRRDIVGVDDRPERRWVGRRALQVVQDEQQLLARHRIARSEARALAVFPFVTVDHARRHSPVRGTGVPFAARHVGKARLVFRLFGDKRCCGVGVGVSPENHRKLGARQAVPHAEGIGIRVAAHEPLRDDERHARRIPLPVVDVAESGLVGAAGTLALDRHRDVQPLGVLVFQTFLVGRDAVVAVLRQRDGIGIHLPPLVAAGARVVRAVINRRAFFGGKR